MFCSACGTQIIEGAKFCQSCGQVQASSSNGAMLGNVLRSGNLAKSVWKWTVRVIVGLLTVAGLLSILMDAIESATGARTTANAHVGVFWWSIGVAYFFKTLSWKKSAFVIKHPIMSGLFSAWLIGVLIYAIVPFFVHRS